MSSSPVDLPVDTRVLISGLTAWAVWNGKEGVIKGALKSGRYPVAVTTAEGAGKILNLKASNLAPVAACSAAAPSIDDTCWWCSAASVPKLACEGCGFAKYCSKTCRSLSATFHCQHCAQLVAEGPDAPVTAFTAPTPSDGLEEGENKRAKVNPARAGQCLPASSSYFHSYKIILNSMFCTRACATQTPRFVPPSSYDAQACRLCARIIWNGVISIPSCSLLQSPHPFSYPRGFSWSRF